MRREIVHVNTDDFYASVLRLRDSNLYGRPVVVSGPPPRGVVHSASYEARGDGVKRGMTVSRARKLCPRGKFLPPDWRLFRRVSGELIETLRGYSPVLETASLDECYLDYTGCSRLMGDVLDAAVEIKADVKDRTGLQVSLGVASSRLVSHVASREAKRAHLVDVSHGCERNFLAPLPVRRFPLVGEKDAQLLIELGIYRVGDILRFPQEIFSWCFGCWGGRLYRGAMGEDDSPVRPAPKREKSFAAGRELDPDRVNIAFLEAVIYSLCERLGEDLRRDRAAAGSLRMELTYTDGKAVSKAARLDGVSDDEALFAEAQDLMKALFRRRVRIRRICLEAGRISRRPRQLALFSSGGGGDEESRRRLRLALDDLRGKFPPGVAPAFGKALAAVERCHR